MSYSGVPFMWTIMKSYKILLVRYCMVWCRTVLIIIVLRSIHKVCHNHTVFSWEKDQTFLQVTIMLRVVMITYIVQCGCFVGITLHCTVVTRPNIHTHSSVSPSLIAITPQPLQSSLHFKLHIISSEGSSCKSQSPHGFGCHLHYHLVIGWQQVPQVISKPTHFGRVPTINADKSN